MNITNIPLTPKHAPAAIIDNLNAGLVPFIKGSPGIGKSDIVRQVAKKLNLKMIDIRLAQSDPTDLSGFPVRNATTGRMEYAPLSTIPLEEDPLPVGYDGWLIIFDEITSAPPSVQAAAYKVILDRLVNQTPLHVKVRMVAAGNLESDRAVVVKMSTALKSRFIHFTLETNLAEWLDYFAYPTQVHSDVISFLRFKPNLLHNFDPDSAEDTFPCPRTWDFVNRFIKSLPDDTPLLSKPHHLISIAGAVGQGAALEFKTALNQFHYCPSIEEVIATPETAKMPDELSQLYATSTMLSNYADDTNIEPIITYIDRIPRDRVEFQVNTVKDIIKRNPALEMNPKLANWMINNARKLYGNEDL
ncbi:MAG: AAA domain-containing protein [Gammaproteobacteria bacterium]|jgi:hypothetical protein|nr:AAA domain-containing protein [Gammaproteobacteria bacterium]